MGYTLTNKLDSLIRAGFNRLSIFFCIIPILQESFRLIIIERIFHMIIQGLLPRYFI